MPKASAHSIELGRARSSSRMSDKLLVIIPILACAYAKIIFPLLLCVDPEPRAGAGGRSAEAQQQILNAPRLDHKIFWPSLAAISVILSVRNWSRITLLPHTICLLAYLAFAGASISWAFKPEFSSVRFFQQPMIITSILLPPLMAARTVDMMRVVFLCFTCLDREFIFFYSIKT